MYVHGNEHENILYSVLYIKKHEHLHKNMNMHRKMIMSMHRKMNMSMFTRK